MNRVIVSVANIFHISFVPETIFEMNKLGRFPKGTIQAIFPINWREKASDPIRYSRYV